MKIAVDIDGVLYDWEGTARLLLRQYRNMDIPVSKRWDYIPETISDLDWAWLWSAGVDLGLFRHGHVVKGSIEGMRALAKSHELVIVTHRPAVAIHDTLKWIGLHLDTVRLAGLHLLTNEEPKTMVEADLLIDDRISNVEAWSRNQGRAILFSQPWNEDFDWWDWYQEEEKAELAGYQSGYDLIETTPFIRRGQIERATDWSHLLKKVGSLKISKELQDATMEAAGDRLRDSVTRSNALSDFLRTSAGNANASRESGPDWPSFDHGPDCG